MHWQLKTVDVQMKTRLKGKNRIRLFRQAAERLVSKIVANGNVAGVIFLGGLVRGFADKYSDVDIVVLLRKRDELLRKKIQNIGIEERKRSGLDIDLEIHYLRTFQEWEWDETDRWDFSHAKIVYDPRGRIRRMFADKLKVAEGFWVERIVTCAEYMKWYCCPPTHGVSPIAEAWVDRGDLLSAHYCLNCAVDLLMETVFALNKEFLPPPKWRIFYLQNLKWVPGELGLLRDAVYLKRFTVEDLDRRLRSLREVWQTVLAKIQEETGLTSDLITKCYAERVLHQMPVH